MTGAPLAAAKGLRVEDPKPKSEVPRPKFEAQAGGDRAEQARRAPVGLSVQVQEADPMG